MKSPYNYNNVHYHLTHINCAITDKICVYMYMYDYFVIHKWIQPLQEMK